MLPVILDWFAGLFTWTLDDYIAMFKVIATFIGLAFLYIELKRQRAKADLISKPKRSVRFQLPPNRNTTTGSILPEFIKTPETVRVQVGAKQRWRCSRCKGILDESFRLRSGKAVCSAC